MTNLTLARLDAAAPDFGARLTHLLAFNDATDDAVQSAVTEILAAVKARGDAAVIEYTARFDRLEHRRRHGEHAGIAAGDDSDLLARGRKRQSMPCTVEFDAIVGGMAALAGLRGAT